MDEPTVPLRVLLDERHERYLKMFEAQEKATARALAEKTSERADRQSWAATLVNGLMALVALAALAVALLKR